MTLSRRAMVAGLGALAAPFVPPPPAPRPGAPGPPAVSRRPDARPSSPGTRASGPSWPGSTGSARTSSIWRTATTGSCPSRCAAPIHRNVDHLNEVNSRLLRTTYKEQADQVRERIATLLGVSMGEIALTRGGTEALQNLIAGYRRLRPGDAVMYTDLDYHSARYAMNWLRDRRGVRVERMVVPEPGDPPGRAGRLRRGAA